MSLFCRDVPLLPHRALSLNHLQDVDGGTPSRGAAGGVRRNNEGDVINVKSSHSKSDSTWVNGTRRETN